MSKRWMVIATAAAMMLSIGACSSGSSASGPTAEASDASTTAPTTSSGPTKASYIAEATAICADMNARSAQLSEDYDSGPRTRETAAAMVRDQSGVIETTVAELRALPRPPGDEATLDAAYEAAAAIPPAANTVADALERGDAAAEVDRLGTIADQLTAAANDAMDAYGLYECGSGSSTTTA